MIIIGKILFITVVASRVQKCKVHVHVCMTINFCQFCDVALNYKYEIFEFRFDVIKD